MIYNKDLKHIEFSGSRLLRLKFGGPEKGRELARGAQRAE